VIDPRLERFLASQPTLVDTAAADLAALIARQAADKEVWLDKLRQQVRGLDEGENSSSLLDEPMDTGAGSTARGPAPTPQPQREWRPPQRRTHGGNFGPAVVAKLRREALGG
jgi:hypothetical protein